MRFSFFLAKQASNLRKDGFDLAADQQVILTAETEDHIPILSMRKADRCEQAIDRDNLA